MQLLRGLRRWQKRLRALVHTGAVDQELNEEMSYHLELETKKNISLGMTPADARRKARVAFGAVEQHRIATREARWGSWFPDLSLDFRLGGRMLVKHPALTVIATIAVAFAIAVGTVGFEVARQALWPTIPLPDGNAIVALQDWNVADNASVRASRREYEDWRGGFRTITDFSAVALEERSVAIGAGAGEPELVANVTPSTFVLTRVQPLKGRTLLETDERSDAEDVVVVGYSFWKERLNSAEDAVGRVIRISGTPFTIVGVMPHGYGFPQRNAIWRPLHLARIPDATRSLALVFGRLAPGRSRREAIAEATVFGARSSTMFPETNRNVRLQVRTLPDVASEFPDEAAMVLGSINVFLVLLGALLCGNVAMLLFARAASRERELLVRAALGASRRRLIMQLFAEALVLCAVGAAVGVIAAKYVLVRAWAEFAVRTGPLPFWIDTSLSTTTILYAAGLMILAAALVGIIPALKVTSRSAGGRLRAATTGGGGLQFGGVWTVVIVAQIALMTVLPVPLIGLGAGPSRNTPVGFPAETFLTATLAIDRFDGVAASGDTIRAVRAARLETRYNALADRLGKDPNVLAVTYADQMPLMRTNWRAIKLDSGPAAPHSERCVGGYCVGVVFADPRFFDVVGTRVVRGRALTTSDAEYHTRSALVNEFFVEQVMGGRNPIGRRFHFSEEGEPGAESWYEIVGIVPDLGVSDNKGDFGRARIFQATMPKETGPLRVAIRVRGDPQRFVSRLRELAQATDPALRVIDPRPMLHPGEASSKFWLDLLFSLTGVTLMLSLAGVYAITAFAVTRRTREIGVRVALGARPLQVLRTIFKRPLVQVSLGIGVGAILSIALANNDLSDVHLDDFVNTAGYTLATILCCALACVVPTRRALRIEPTEALKEEG